MLTDYNTIERTPHGFVVLKFDSEQQSAQLYGLDPVAILTNPPNPKLIMENIRETTFDVPGIETVLCQCVVNYDPQYTLVLYPHCYFNAGKIAVADDRNWPAIGLLQKRLGELIAPKEISGKFSMFPQLQRNLAPLKQLYRQLTIQYPQGENLIR
jgi:hypothetical protein